MAATNREEELFLAALEQRTPAVQAAFLDEACARDAPLRHRVEALLRAHAQADSVLDQPAIEVDAACDARTRTLRLSTSSPAAEPADRTQAEPAEDEQSLSFLAPASIAGALGRLDHHDVLEVVGQGGMGIVLKARDTTLERIVAIKVLAPQLAASGNARKRFAREAKAAAAVRDEHVVDIHAVNDSGPIPYLVMEYIGGITLDDRIKQGGALEVKEILRIGFQTACGLAAAHKQGLIHRDIKPANILLENGVQRVKITDFGLARAADDASLTQSGVIAGTPMYMSPEQARGEPVDHRSDLFSLGSVMYTLCTGHPAFRAANTMAVLKRVCDDTPRPIREANPDIPDWLAAIVASLLAKAPAERFQSAAELAELLSQHLAHLQQPQLAPRPLPVSVGHVANVPQKGHAGNVPHKSKRLRVMAAAAVLLLTAGAITTYVMVRQGEPPTLVPADGPPIVKGTDEAFDALKREDIAPALLALAGGGDPAHAPPELVAVLGETRFRMPNGGPTWRIAQNMAGVLAIGCGNQIALYEAATGRLLRVLTGHKDRVFSVAFSPDGNRLASASWDKTVKVWDTRTGQETLSLPGHTDQVWSVAFSADGQRIASASSDKTVKVWDADKGTELHSFQGHTGNVLSVCFSPDGKRIASGSNSVGNDFTVRVWDVDKGEEVLSLKGHTHIEWIWSVAFSPDGMYLATGSDNELILWDAATLKKIHTFNTPAGWLAFTPDSKTLFAGRTNCRQGQVHAVTRWDVAGGQPLPSFTLQSQGAGAVYHLSPDGKTLHAMRENPTEPFLHAYDAETGKELFPHQGHDGRVYSVAVSPDGKLLASGGEDRIVRVWNLAEWKKDEALPPVRTFPGHTDVVWCVSFSPDGKFLASSSRDHTITLWDLVGGGDAQTLPGAADVAVRMAFSPDGRNLIAGCEDGGVRSWQLPGNKEAVLLCRHAARVRCVAFSPDGTLMASAGDDRQVWVSDVRTTRRRQAFTLSTIVNNVAFSSDGKTLAATDDAPDSAVHLWDVADWKEVRLAGHASHVGGLAFSPVAPLLATGSHDGTLRFWDLSPSALARGEAMRDVPHVLTIGPGPFGGIVQRVAFTPEGRHLVTANDNGTIAILKVPALAPPYDPGPAKELPGPAELAKRPSAADALRREDIPPELLQKAAAAAGGKAPPELVAILPHGNEVVVSLAISPDGKLLASGAAGAAKVWDLATGKLLYTCPNLTHDGVGVAFVPGRDKGTPLLFATAGWSSRTVKLSDAATGQELRTLSGHAAEVGHVAPSPDGRWLASYDQSGTIHVWDPATGKHLRTMRPPGLNAYADLVASPDSRLLATAGDDGAVRLWDPWSGWLLATLFGHQGPARAIAFLPDGRTLASSGQTDNTIRLWDLATLRQKQMLKGTRTTALKVAWRADGRLLASDDSVDGTVRLWDPTAEPAKCREIRLFPAPVRFLHGVAMTPEGRYLATANPDGTVYVLRLAAPGVDFRLPPDPVTLKPTATLPAHDGRVTAVAFGPGSGNAASGGKDGTIKLWDLDKSEVRLTLPAHSEGVRTVVFAPGGKTLASAGIDGGLALWDAANGKKLHTLAGHPGGAAPLLFAGPAGPLLSGGADGAVRFWDIATGQPQRTLSACNDWLTHLSLHSDGRTLATAGNDRTVRLWDLETAKAKQSLADRTCVCFAPDGTRLAVVTRAGHIEVLDGRTLELCAVLAGHSEPPDCVCFSPDSKLLASCGLDRSIRVWDAARGHLLAQLSGHAGQVWSLAWSADSKTLAAGDEDGRLLRWTLAGYGI